jgi:DNA polymerase I-like protein with 3'-5' exonuclease and polymerase domains
MPVTSYYNETESAKAAVSEIVQLLASGQVELSVGFDLETSPIAGLTDYPSNRFDEAGERVTPNKRDYLGYTQALWRSAFNGEALARIGLFVPRKLTSGNETKGVPVRLAWELFLSRLNELEATGNLINLLDSCRWTEAELLRQTRVCAGQLKAAQAQIAQTEAAIAARPLKGLRKLERALKADQAELAEHKQQLSWLAQAAVAPQVDTRLLVHIARCGAEPKRIKIDPIKPGLDPYTADIFLLQMTLVRKGAYTGCTNPTEYGNRLRQLLAEDSDTIQTWLFNVQKIDKEALRPLLRLPGARYLGANIKFDLKHTLHYWSEAPKNVFCTRVANRMLFLGLRNVSHSLAATTERHLGLKLSKEERNLFVGRRYEEPTEDMLRYAARDTEVLLALAGAQEAIAATRGQVDLLDTFSRLSYPTAISELVGFRLDTAKWLSNTAFAVQERDQAAAQLEQMLLPVGYADLLGGTAVNQPTEDGEEDEGDPRPSALIRISQGALVLERLVDVLGRPVFQQTFEANREKPSLDKDARELLETNYIKLYGKSHPFFSLYTRWVKMAKAVSTYGVSFLHNVHPLTGRIHASLHIAGTDTGRFSSTEPNALNIPRGEDGIDFRGAFLAPEGYLFGGADYASMEQRIAAALTGDPVLTALFEANGDSHSVSAAMMYHVRRGAVSAPVGSVEDWREGSLTDSIPKVLLPASWTPLQVVEWLVKERCFEIIGKDGQVKAVSLMELIEAKHKKTTRQSAKTVGLGKQFGMSKFGIARKKNIPLAQAEEIENLYDGTYAVMKAGQDAAARKPFENYTETEDGERFGYGEAYNNLRRWFLLPHNPSRREYQPGSAGDTQFQAAQREYKKRCGAIEREAKNVGTQGGNAVITAEATLLLLQMGGAHRPAYREDTPEGRLRLGIFPFLSIYDELLCLVPTGVSEKDANAVITGAMLEPSEKYIVGVPSKAEGNPLDPCWVKH